MLYTKTRIEGFREEHKTTENVVFEELLEEDAIKIMRLIVYLSCRTNSTEKFPWGRAA